MKIEKIKINSYGTLKNKEINLEKINIIYGKNESGKSTLLNFIKNIFYGISKNKNGKEISDYEKYLPWNSEEFSGKIKYILDNNDEYEIFRDFYKKNPQVINGNFEEISSKFKIDKKEGNQFFYEQTGVDEKVYISTIMTPQQEVVLDNSTKNNLLQKVANVGETGDYEVSFSKVIDSINKRQIEEVGTKRTQDRPINIVQNRSEELKFVLKDEKMLLESKKKLQNRKEEILQKLEEEKQRNEIVKKENQLLYNEQIEKEKINIKNKLEKENKYKNKKIILIIIFILLIIINILNFIFSQSKIINYIILMLIPINIFLFILNVKNKNKINNENNNKIKNNLNSKKINNKLSNKKLKNNLYSENKNNKKIDYNLNNENLNYKEINYNLNNENLNNKEINYNLINEYSNNKKTNNNLNNEKLNNKKTNNLINELENNNLKNEINNINLEEKKKELEQKSEKINQKILDYELQLNGIKYEENKISEETEKIIAYKEEQANIKEQLEILEEKNICFQAAKNLLQKAYEKMKNDVTPKFTKNLSQIIKEISNGKYEKISINEQITVELENGRVVSANNLSIGTIDEIYLALRLSMLDEISKEKMPIILDETFAYFDEERLENILLFLQKQSEKHQIILFTCTNREKQILDKLKINYNFIEL